MNTDMKAVILAAGKGTRLYPLTLERPKCLLEIEGKGIIQREIETLRQRGIDDIVVVVGYKKDIITSELGDQVRYREYADFDQTNNLHTLWSIRDELENGFLCLFSDLIFDDEVIQELLDSDDDICLACDTSRVREGTMRITLNDGRISGVGGHIPVEEGSGNFLGLAKFSARGAKVLLEQMSKMVEGHQEDYYTIAIDSLVREGLSAGHIELENRLWIEVDTCDDLDQAKALLAERRDV